MAREYKDSGIEWIGQIPKEWKLATLKQIGTYINGYAFKPEDWTDSGKPIIRIQDLTGSMGSPNFYNGELDSKYLVNKGDILVSWAATLDAFIWEKEEGWLNQHIFKALPSSDVNYQFFYWLIKLAMENMNNDNKHGIVMQHVTTKVFGNFAVCIPSVNEQQKIADYLDKVCGEVDEMVALQETMIEELKAYKQSVITEAVTHGLNPNVKFKDSGIDWIGKIPQGWEVVQLKRYAKVNNGKEVPVELSADDENAKPVYGSGGVFKYTNEIMYSGEAVMFGRKGTLGKPLYVNDSFWVVDTMYFLTYPNKLFPKYSYYQLSAFDWNPFITQTAIPSIVASDVMAAFICVPPLTEQHQIADYLDNKCSEIDSLIAIKQQKIEELKDYKKSIIYEYVTGKKEING